MLISKDPFTNKTSFPGSRTFHLYIVIYFGLLSARQCTQHRAQEINEIAIQEGKLKVKSITIKVDCFTCLPLDVAEIKCAQ